MAEQVGKNNEVVYKVANKSDMDTVFRIRYEAYLKQGYIKPNELLLLTDEFDDLQFSISFLAICGDKPFGTMRIVIDSDKFGLPMDKEGFSQDIKHLRQQGRKLAEVCKLSVLKDNDVESFPKGILLGIQKIMLNYAYRNYVNDLVITVVPKHTPFYEKVLLFEKLNNGIYHSLNSIQAISMRLNIDTLEECYRGKYQNTRLDLHQHFFGGVGKTY